MSKEKLFIGDYNRIVSIDLEEVEFVEPTLCREEGSGSLLISTNRGERLFLIDYDNVSVLSTATKIVFQKLTGRKKESTEEMKNDEVNWFDWHCEPGLLDIPEAFNIRIFRRYGDTYKLESVVVEELCT